MFCKLALRNVRKSIKDYLIYFLTLTFGVCLFYLFNSLDSQTAVMALSESKKITMRMLVQAINYISVFVAVVLGFLIIYANGFLIRRRKKKFGLYMTLGMDRSRVSRLLMLETLFIGLSALAVGLVAGIFLSQGFSIITAHIFEVNLASFRFVFSAKALEKTILYFGVIFFIVMLFNAVSVARLKLIDLLNGGKKNEKLPLRNFVLSVILFLFSIICLVFAYRLFIQNGLAIMDRKFSESILLGCLGTVLFFFSLSGILLRSAQKSKKLYYRGLNMFTLRQFNSKINTTYVSISVICLMLLVTIGTLSCGLGVAHTLNDNLKKLTPYDASLVQSFPEMSNSPDITAKLKKDGVEISAAASGTSQIIFRTSDATLGKMQVSEKEVMEAFGMPADSAKHLCQTPLNSISESEYNQAAKLQGKPEISLGSDKYAIVNMNNQETSIMNNILKKGTILKIGGQSLKPSGSSVLSTSLVDYRNTSLSVALVVPDRIVKQFKEDYSVLNVNFKSDAARTALESKLTSVYGYLSGTTDADKPDRPYDEYNTRQSIIDQQKGLTTSVAYVAIYIGIVFLIAGAAVLAIQQLSETADNTERYGLLHKLGADEKMINHALFTQIGLYFLLPLFLAIFHSIAGIYGVNQTIKQSGRVDITHDVLFTIFIFLVIYGAYFLATYFGSRRMLRQDSEK